MSRTLIVRSEAEQEALEAASWYEQRNPRSAAEFIAAFRTVLTQLVENPLQYQVVEDDMRRAPVGKYLYGLLYVATEHEVIILSCLHGRRDPALWRERLQQ
jgi:toxin ParE1/3/4